MTILSGLTDDKSVFLAAVRAPGRREGLFMKWAFVQFYVGKQKQNYFLRVLWIISSNGLLHDICGSMKTTRTELDITCAFLSIRHSTCTYAL